MARTIYVKSVLTGGAANALDGIDGSNLLNDDIAFVIYNQTNWYCFALDADSAAAESSPSVISPDNNAGDKRWLLLDLVALGISLYKKTNVADAAYGTSALTTDYIVAWTSLSAARAAVISTEDEDSGTTTQPRIMIFKDESGNAGTYPITISLESGGTINGASTYVLNTNYEAVNIYLDGTNGFIY